MTRVIEDQRPAAPGEDIDQLEPVMLIRGRSAGSAECLRVYAAILARKGAPAEDIAAIREQAARMAKWPKTYPEGTT